MLSRSAVDTILCSGAITERGCKPQAWGPHIQGMRLWIQGFCCCILETALLKQDADDF